MIQNEIPESGEQGRLPLDLQGDPIPFALTAKARRAVAPDSLPDLTVVGDGEGGQRQADTRPLRARALRRAGMSWTEIAAELDVDELLVRAWVEHVSPVHGATRTPPGQSEGPEVPDRSEAVDRRAREVYHNAREAARRTGEHWARGGPPAGLGVLVGLARLDEPAVVVTADDPVVAGAALGWLRRRLDLDARDLRAVLRLAPRVAGDEATDRWLEALGVPGLRLITTRWTSAPHAEATQLLLRITDPAAAGEVAGLRDALLGSLSAPPARDETAGHAPTTALGA